MENLEKGVRARNEEELPKPHNAEIDLRKEIIDLLKTRKIDDPEIEQKFYEWEEFNDINRIQDERDLDAYIKLGIKKSEILIEADLKNQAIEMLDNLYIMADTNNYSEIDTIKVHLDNLGQ